MPVLTVEASGRLGFPCFAEFRAFALKLEESACARLARQALALVGLALMGAASGLRRKSR